VRARGEWDWLKAVPSSLPMPNVVFLVSYSQQMPCVSCLSQVFKTLFLSTGEKVSQCHWDVTLHGPGKVLGRLWNGKCLVYYLGYIMVIISLFYVTEPAVSSILNKHNNLRVWGHKQKLHISSELSSGMYCRVK
jgi:hypothetical protein